MNKPHTFINPLTDFGFKWLFGQKKHKRLLLSFLNSLLSSENKIVDVTFIDKEIKQEHPDNRALIYDLHCTTDDGRKIIVEMQNRYQTHFDDRALYYMASGLVEQAQKGNAWDYCLSPVFGIFLMNFDWKDPEVRNIREDVVLYNLQKNRIHSDKLHMIFLKVPLMTMEADECQTALDRWLYIFRNLDNLEQIPESFMKDPIFAELRDVARVAALSGEERRAYESSLKSYRDAYAIAQTERAEGRAEGLIEGEAKGLAKGLAEGEAIGTQKTSIAIVSKMLESGLDIETISRFTGISETAIERLLAN